MVVLLRVPGFNPISCLAAHNICFLPQYFSVAGMIVNEISLSLSLSFYFWSAKNRPPISHIAWYNVSAISMESTLCRNYNGRFFHLPSSFSLSLLFSLAPHPLLPLYTHTHTPARALKTSSLEKQSGLIYGWGGKKLLSLNCIWTHCSSVMFQYGANRVEVRKMMLISHQYHYPSNFSTLCCALVENVC